MKIKLSLWKLYQIILRLLSLIKRNFIAANTLLNANQDIVFDSFPNAERVIVRNKRISNNDIYLTLPLLTPLNFNINNITDELYRLETIYNVKSLIYNKYMRQKLLIIFNNIYSYGIVKFLIEKNNFNSYHSISNNIDAYNISKVIEKETSHKLNVNDLESNIESAVRLLKDDYDNIYEHNTTTLYIMSNDDNLSDLLSVIEYKTNCYISMPKNNFLLLLLRHLFYYHKVLTIVNQNSKFILLKVDSNKNNFKSSKDIYNDIVKYFSSFFDKK